MPKGSDAGLRSSNTGGGLRVLDPSCPRRRPAGLRRRLDASSRPLQGDLHHKSHLLFAWLAALARCLSVLDTVQDLHGPELQCNFFIKRRPIRLACSAAGFDLLGLSKPDVVTAWVAFPPATEANGVRWVVMR
jgi:non-haem Fe2+, alpha-ketoglutarate-dependent halogenase